MNIQFLGATESVTGSCHLITTKKYKILLDCGQFQGGKQLEALNREPFPFNPQDIDFLILSHAHIDHSGRIPLLVKQGFTGQIYCTKATHDLSAILLKDGGFIHEKEAEWESRKRLRAGKQPVEPVYTALDAEKAMVYFDPVLYDQTIQVTEDIKLRFVDAGHLLGSAIIELWITEDETTTKIVFSGDLGMPNKPLLRDPQYIEEADYLIMESTYGNRLHHEMEHRVEILIDIILKTIKRSGTVVIPSFAVGRTQEIIYELNKYYDDKKLSKEDFNNIHVYIDSPLATNATEIFEENAQVFDEETRHYILNGDNPLNFRNLHFTRSTEESIALNNSKEPKVIISASGMCNAGRIKHHLKHNLWIPEASIIFVGYQAEGTLGRRIKDGEKDVKIFGENIHINAEIYSIEGFSGHADQNELLHWLSQFHKAPRKIFLVHGEDDSKKELQNKIKEKLKYDCIIPGTAEVYQLNHETQLIGKSKEKEISTEKLSKLKDDLHNMREDFKTTIYQSLLSLSDDITEENYNKIKNKIIELQKDIINLSITTDTH